MSKEPLVKPITPQDVALALEAMRTRKAAYESSSNDGKLKAYQRMTRLVDYLRAMLVDVATVCNCRLHVTVGNEFSLVALKPNKTVFDALRYGTGGFGRQFADYLNACEGARTGINYSTYFTPENGWCYLAFMGAVRLVDKATDELLHEDRARQTP